MIPIEFIETKNLQEELNRFEAKLEQDILCITDSELAQKIEEHKHTNYESEPEQQLRQQINNSFNNEYKKLEKSQSYFLGCPSSIYSHHYEKRLEAFKNTYTDSQEHNFIYDELQTLINFKLPNYIDNLLTKKIGYSIERSKDFLINRLEQLGFIVDFSVNNEGTETLAIKNNHKDFSIHKQNTTKLKWLIGVTDLVELGMSLIEYNAVNVGKGKDDLSEKDFYTLLADFVNIDKLNHERLKQDIRKREKDETIFLPKLNDKLRQAINDKLK